MIFLLAISSCFLMLLLVLLVVKPHLDSRCEFPTCNHTPCTSHPCARISCASHSDSSYTSCSETTIVQVDESVRMCSPWPCTIASWGCSRTQLWCLVCRNYNWLDEKPYVDCLAYGGELTDGTPLVEQTDGYRRIACVQHIWGN
jgi:hypothetical protein